MLVAAAVVAILIVQRPSNLRNGARHLVGNTLGALRTVIVAGCATYALIALLTFLTKPDRIEPAATAALLAVQFAILSIASLFLARQFLAPPWWRLQAWSPGANHGASLRSVLSWILDDSWRVVQELPVLSRLVVVLGVPLLAWDLVRLFGTEAILRVGLVTLLVLYVALGVALVTANRIPRVLMSRLQELRVVTRRIAGGDFSARVGVTELGDYEELDQLVRDINSMALALQSRDVENRQLHAQLQTTLHHEQERATRDGLTGLRNHRYFQESLHAELDRCARNGGQVSICILDLDNFKQVNDRYGHQEGDAVLLRVTQALQDRLRPYDLACRLGGEEFGVIFPETSPLEAKSVLDHLAETVRGCGPAGTVASFSAGVASYPAHAQDQPTLYQLADEAAYTAKSRGKAQSVIYDPANVVSMGSKERIDQRERDALLATARTLVGTVDARESLSRNHSELVGRYSASIASALGLGEDFVSQMYLCGLLHDVGKIGLSDEIVQKAGRLSQAEFDQVKQHPELSFQIVNHAGMEDIAVWVRHHHEHWDGSGYPDGLAGEAIPLGSRIVLAAEAFEVMTSDRVYRRALSAQQAIDELARFSGTTFDPTIVQALINLVVGGAIVPGMETVGPMPGQAPNASAATQLFEHPHAALAPEQPPAHPDPRYGSDPNLQPGDTSLASWPPRANGHGEPPIDWSREAA